MVHTPRRAAAPTQLVLHRDRWTDRLRQIQSGGGSGDWATPTAKRVIRDALRPITHGKCIYCEGALDLQSELAIEHYVAKSVDVAQSFEWMNLLPACRMCNGAKAEADHGGALLKADVEDPEPFFWIHPDTGKLEPHPRSEPAGQVRAQRTIELCNLQRAALCTKRIEMLNQVSRWLTRISEAPTADLIAEWNELRHPGREYKFVLRHVLRQHNQFALELADRDKFASG